MIFRFLKKMPKKLDDYFKYHEGGGDEKDEEDENPEMAEYEDISAEIKDATNIFFKTNPFLKIATERFDEDGFSLDVEEMKTTHAETLLIMIPQEKSKESSSQVSAVVGYIRSQLRTLDEFGITTESDIQIAQWFLKEGALAFAEIGDGKEKEIKDVDVFLVLVATKVAQEYYAEKTITRNERVTRSLSLKAPALFEKKTTTLSPQMQLHQDLIKNNALLLKRLKTIMNTLLKEFFVEHELDGVITCMESKEDEDEDEMGIDFEALDIQDLIKARVDKNKLEEKLASFYARRNRKLPKEQTIRIRCLRNVLDADTSEEMLLFLLRDGLITEFRVPGSIEVDKDALEQYNALIKKSKSERGRTNFIAKTSLGEGDFCDKAMEIFKQEKFGMASWKRVKENFESILSAEKDFTLQQLSDAVSGFIGKILLLYLYDVGLIDRYDARAKSRKGGSFKSDILEEKTSDFYRYRFIVTQEGETELLQSAHDFLQSKGLLLDETSE